MSREPFTQTPKTLGEVGIDRPRSDTEHLGRCRRDSDGDVAVLAVDATHSVELRAGRAPDTRRSSLLWSLHAPRVNDRFTVENLAPHRIVETVDVSIVC